eukprot:TRINITY_DN13060_c0_g1_i2.p2 TRINITY_DN13060_c0_g1~~TRINITY_DN13060_c0_g1_i2.p2  ORF type:complete len:132 (-),score=25.40 TRINITY_DN13060_c0_g1_i2:42-437(-)
MEEKSVDPPRGVNKLMLIVGIIVGSVLGLWLIVGRIEAYSYDSDNENLRGEVSRKTKEIKKFNETNNRLNQEIKNLSLEIEGLRLRNAQLHTQIKTCLLYTSDAADDTPCVDLGGRRIIKKKKLNTIRQTW